MPKNKIQNLSVLNMIPDEDTADMVNTVIDVIEELFPGAVSNLAESTASNLIAALDKAIGKKIEIIKHR